MKEEIYNLIQSGDSIRTISKKLNMGYSTVRYWIGKYKIQNHNKSKDIEVCSKRCPRCRELKNISLFYESIRNGKKRYGYCKDCSNEYATQRMINVKKNMIEYKGGSCERCGITIKESNYFIFDFHHINTKEKDPNFKRIKFQKWESIKKELNKCMLVCSNCHRTIHYLENIGSVNEN